MPCAFLPSVRMVLLVLLFGCSFFGLDVSDTGAAFGGGVVSVLAVVKLSSAVSCAVSDGGVPCTSVSSVKRVLLVLLFGCLFFGLDVSDNGVAFGGGVVSVSCGAKVSGVVIAGGMFCMEDPAVVSGGAVAFDDSNGVSSQQVSRIKTCLSLVLSGSKRT